MLNAITEINVPVTVAFPRGGILTVLPANINIVELFEATALTVSVPAVEVTPGIITVTYTPIALGRRHLVADGNVITNLEIISSSIPSSLELLKDAAFGSWFLDKTTKVLTLFDRQGGAMELYDVVDNTAQTSREKQ